MFWWKNLGLRTLHYPRGKERSLVPLKSMQVRASPRTRRRSNSLRSWRIPWSHKVAYLGKIKRGQGYVGKGALEAQPRGPESSLGPRNGVRQVMRAHSRLQVEVPLEGA